MVGRFHRTWALTVKYGISANNEISYLLKSVYIFILYAFSFTKMKSTENLMFTALYGTPAATRTRDTQLRRLVLYPAELRAHIWILVKTRFVIGYLESWCPTQLSCRRKLKNGARITARATKKQMERVMGIEPT